MKKFQIFILIMVAIFTAGSSLLATMTKQAIIRKIKDEKKLFMYAMKAVQSCFKNKQCSDKEKQNISKAIKHATVMLGLITLLGTLSVLIYKKNTLPKIEQETIVGNLSTAISQQNNKKMQELLKAYKFDKSQLNDLIIIAIAFGTSEAVEELLKHGASAQHIDQQGNSLLYHAVRRANQSTQLSDEPQIRRKIIETLLQAKAPVNHQNGPMKITALMEAAQGKNNEIIQLLLKHNANKILKDTDGETAYDYAKKANADQEILDSLELPK